MDQLNLEPFAARIRWRFPEAQPLSRWQSLVASFLDQVALACATNPSVVIGHIKGLALLPGGGFLRGSKVSTKHSADVEIADAQTGECQELEMALNVLVYGLAWSEAKRIVLKAGDAIATQAGAMFEVVAIERHDHHHDREN